MRTRFTPKDKPCRMCGEMMYGVMPHRIYCETCIREREKLRRKYGYVPEQRKKTALSVAEVAAAAKAAGMSYGQYVAKMQRGEVR